MRKLMIATALLCASAMQASSGDVELDQSRVSSIQIAAETAPALPSERIEASSRLPTPRPTTLEEKIGQMIMVGFRGDTPDHKWVKTLTGQIEAGKVSGVLYLRRNVTNQTQVANLNAALQIAARDRPSLLIAVDQEGGRIERLLPEAGFPHTPSAAEISSDFSPREAYERYELLAESLSAWGFNLNLGPVVDLNVNRSNPIIGRLGRSYSDDPSQVVQFATAFVTAHREQGVLTALKHFPGHGSSKLDSHKGAVDVSRTWKSAELDPFSMMIKDKQVDLVMSAHLRNDKLQDDGDKAPISLSKSGLHDVLRRKLGFTGVIISDDLQMGAIWDNYKFEDAVIRAVKAGNDILIFSNDKHPDVDIPNKVVSLLSKAAKHDAALQVRIEQAYENILAMKQDLQAQAPALDTISTRSIGEGESRPVLSSALMAANKRDFPLYLPADL
ncbi:glycoside hydrolase family 3 N-terminal domain-containing protein [Oricola sp.]|uniref:glycoside hydrolase family 3 protein n=1 Tax=Oricola sp. TaxID=1979950 RepID=UPI0025F44BA8|nr:glycoside hydrolase family 3 N-terminal domain-containing protein [Oricola sp.]MCI5076127.1 glycoside hydrolase family 3 protein [Oricola sp.]